MGRLTGCARVVPLLALACSCGGSTIASSGSSAGGSGSESGGSASGGFASGSSASGGSASGGSASSASGGSAQASGGRSGGSTKCKMVEGRPAYGPIGEPRPLPLPVNECSGCSDSAAYGFRTSAGYGFVWQTHANSSAPAPNLYSLTVGPDFEGGEPQQISQTVTRSADVVVAPNGFIATTCLSEFKPEWIQLNGDLDVAGGATLVAPNAPCRNAPSIVWTGEGYLTAFTDSRGLVVASLDEQGVMSGEKILLPGVVEPAVVRFSKNGDRVLVVFNEKNAGSGLYSVLDLHGTPLGEAQPLLKTNSSLMYLAIAPSGDGWLVASDSRPPNVTGILLTEISRDGFIGRQSRRLGGYPMFLGLTPSAYNGFVLVSQTYSGGQYGEDEWWITLIEGADDAPYLQPMGRDASKTWPIGIVTDPQRDLVIEERVLDGTPTAVVQEYGCLE